MCGKIKINYRFEDITVLNKERVFYLLQESFNSNLQSKLKTSLRQHSPHKCQDYFENVSELYLEIANTKIQDSIKNNLKYLKLSTKRNFMNYITNNVRL